MRLVCLFSCVCTYVHMKAITHIPEASSYRNNNVQEICNIDSNVYNYCFNINVGTNMYVVSMCLCREINKVEHPLREMFSGAKKLSYFEKNQSNNKFITVHTLCHPWCYAIFVWNSFACGKQYEWWSSYFSQPVSG